MSEVKGLTAEQREELLHILENRFVKNMHRHEEIEWDQVKAKLEANEDKLWSLYEMDRTGGEPDVVGKDGEEFIFYDFSPETPVGRRKVCYDRKR